MDFEIIYYLCFEWEIPLNEKAVCGSTTPVVYALTTLFGNLEALYVLVNK